MILITALQPDLGGFLGKHAIGEGHNQLAARAQDPQQFGGDGFRLLQVLPTGGDQHPINAGSLQGQGLVPIQVLNPEAIKPRIGLELCGIKAMADHTPVTDLLGQVADPAGHQIEQLGSSWKALAVELGEAGAETAIEVLHKAWLGIKEGVIAAINLAAIRLR